MAAPVVALVGQDGGGMAGPGKGTGGKGSDMGGSDSGGDGIDIVEEIDEDPFSFCVAF